MTDNFHRGNIDHYLYLVAKEYKKANRYNPEAELTLIGGAAIVVNYGFRNSTTDLDGIIRASSSMKDIITKVGDEQGLNIGWLNDDFKRTISYSPKIEAHSKFYKKFCNCLSVRIIDAEYLLAMKIRSYRQYKHDMSDIIGIVKEHRERQHDISLEATQKAYTELYNEEIDKDTKEFLDMVLNTEDLEELFYSTVELEDKNKRAVLEAEEKYSDVINEDNINGFIDSFRKKQQLEAENSQVCKDDYEEDYER